MSSRKGTTEQSFWKTLYYWIALFVVLVLVDDLIQTGTTMRELDRILRAAGANVDRLQAPQIGQTFFARVSLADQRH